MEELQRQTSDIKADSHLDIFLVRAQVVTFKAVQAQVGLIDRDSACRLARDLLHAEGRDFQCKLLFWNWAVRLGMSKASSLASDMP